MDVPHELAALPNWVRWDADKIPLRADGVTRARSNDPATWSSFDDVKEFDRIGFVLRREDGIVGIDLDGAIVGGELADWAQSIVEDFSSYTEISPSGTGIHIFCKGDWPANGWHKVKVGEKPTDGSKQPGIEVYNHERYFTVTGKQVSDSTELRSAGDALQRLFAKHHKKKAVAESASQSTVATTDERIRSYLAKTDISISGQHGHDRAMWAARCLVTGFRLDYETSLAYLREWNASCVPPWSDAELIHKVEQAIGTPCEKPNGWLLVDRREQPPKNPDIKEQQTAKPVAKLAKVKDDFPFPQDCLRPPGLIGEIVDHNLATAMYPQPELALAGAIALMSLLVGGKVKDMRFNTYPNVYMIGVEKTSSGKEHARDLNKSILAKLGMEHLSEDYIGSDGGLIDYVAEQPNCLLQIDEIHLMLVSMRNVQHMPHMAAVGGDLLKLFTASKNDYRTKLLRSQKRKVIHHPNVSMYGTCPPNGFWKNITFENIDGGLLGRCMVFEGSGWVESQEYAPRDIPVTLLTRSRCWLDFKTHSGNVPSSFNGNNSPLVVLHTEEAYQRARKHQKDIDNIVISGREDEIDSSIWKRTSEKTNKLALLFACSRVTADYAPTIDVQDVDMAIKISNWLTRNMLRQVKGYVSESPFEQWCQEMLRFINKQGTITKTQSSNRPCPLKPRTQRERAEVINCLVEGGNMFVEELATNGRPSVRYHSRAKWEELQAANISDTQAVA